jgi:hypothetical protein
VSPLGWPLLALVAVLGLLPSMPAWSVPAFARGTGLPCAACHTTAFGPALTPYGRNFKIYGYALGTQKTIPLSADLIASFTHTDHALPAQPHYADNNNFAVDQIDGFFAGRIAEHFGAFIKVTYDGIARHTAWDDLDVRYARGFTLGGVNTLLGVSLNNSPTVQDPWNSTPVWQFPFPPTRFGNGPAAQPQLNSAFAQQVLGATFYGLIENTVYLEAGGYQTLNDSLQQHLGESDPGSERKIDGTAPYWRAVLQKSSGAHYASVGIVGFLVHSSLPQSTAVGTDNYSDFGYDATYQFANGGPHTFNANASYIHENQQLFATSSVSGSQIDNHLNTFKIDGQYAYKQTYSITLAYFNTSGSTNQVLMTPAPFFGSANGSPDSSGYTLQVEYVPFGKAGSYGRPFLNLRVGVQYTGYWRLNGGNTNYDGFGHSAQDNNTLFVFFWTAI